MKYTNPRINAELRHEAIEWLITFSEGDVDAAARKRFNDWLRTSPEHVRAYLRVAAFWQDADRVAPEAQRDIDALVQAARAETNIHPLDIAGTAVEKSTRRRSLARPSLALAATILLLIGLGAVAWNLASKRPTFATQPGELRTITLDDGSVVTLNADSRMTVSLGSAERFIDLSDGQALFRVAKDPARPFVVRSGNTRITAVGTQFDVNRKSTGTVVTVLEGRVSVAMPQQTAAPGDSGADPLFVSAGEQAVVTRSETRKHVAASPANATAWTNGLLVFDAEPLREVAREFNRQNAKHLIVEDSDLLDLKISGVFPATGVGRIAQFLRERFGVRVVETDTEIRIEKPQG